MSFLYEISLEFSSANLKIRADSSSLFMKPVPFSSNSFHTSLNYSIADSSTGSYSASDVSEKPYKITAMNKFKNIIVTTSINEIKKGIAAMFPHP